MQLRRILRLSPVGTTLVSGKRGTFTMYIPHKSKTVVAAPLPVLDDLVSMGFVCTHDGFWTKMFDHDAPNFLAYMEVRLEQIVGRLLRKKSPQPSVAADH